MGLFCFNFDFGQGFQECSCTVYRGLTVYQSQKHYQHQKLKPKKKLHHQNLEKEDKGEQKQTQYKKDNKNKGEIKDSKYKKVGVDIKTIPAPLLDWTGLRTGRA